MNMRKRFSVARFPVSGDGVKHSAGYARFTFLKSPHCSFFNAHITYNNNKFEQS